MKTLVGNAAPLFSTDAVVNGTEFVENFSLAQYKGKQNVIFFFYPMDFTFVCPTEIVAFQDKLSAFAERNTAVVACSVDSKFSHFAWLNTDKNKGGIKGVTFPVVADFSKTIAMDYGVLAGNYTTTANGDVVFEGAPVALRGLYLIDKNGIIRHQLINDLPLGRSVDEALRMVDALTFHEENGEVCPANWHKGAVGMKETQSSVAEYMGKN